MALFTWAMMAIAIWHFTIFIPDRFWGGIVGAFVGCVGFGLLIAWIINGLSIPGRADTHLWTALEAIPGSLVGIAVMYSEGVRRKIPPLEL